MSPSKPSTQARYCSCLLRSSDHRQFAGTSWQPCDVRWNTEVTGRAVTERDINLSACWRAVAPSSCCRRLHSSVFAVVDLSTCRKKTIRMARIVDGRWLKGGRVAMISSGWSRAGNKDVQRSSAITRTSNERAYRTAPPKHRQRGARAALARNRVSNKTGAA